MSAPEVSESSCFDRFNLPKDPHKRTLVIHGVALGVIAIFAALGAACLFMTTTGPFFFLPVAGGLCVSSIIALVTVGYLVKTKLPLIREEEGGGAAAAAAPPAAVASRTTGTASSSSSGGGRAAPPSARSGGRSAAAAASAAGTAAALVDQAFAPGMTQAQIAPLLDQMGADELTTYCERLKKEGDHEVFAAMADRPDLVPTAPIDTTLAVRFLDKMLPAEVQKRPDLQNALFASIKLNPGTSQLYVAYPEVLAENRVGVDMSLLVGTYVQMSPANKAIFLSKLPGPSTGGSGGAAAASSGSTSDTQLAKLCVEATLVPKLVAETIDHDLIRQLQRWPEVVVTHLREKGVGEGGVPEVWHSKEFLEAIWPVGGDEAMPRRLVECKTEGIVDLWIDLSTHYELQVPRLINAAMMGYDRLSSQYLHDWLAVDIKTAAALEPTEPPFSHSVAVQKHFVGSRADPVEHRAWLSERFKDDGDDDEPYLAFLGYLVGRDREFLAKLFVTKVGQFSGPIYKAFLAAALKDAAGEGEPSSARKVLYKALKDLDSFYPTAKKSCDPVQIAAFERYAEEAR